MSLKFGFILFVFMAVAQCRIIYNDFTMDNDDNDTPPPHQEYAKMARFLVHRAEWVSMGTISTLKDINGFPMVNIISVADSPRHKKSTGNLYFYLTNLDFTAKDLSQNNKLTVLLSMDQDSYCSKNNIDPMEPTCARIMISGNAVSLTKGTDEYKFAYDSMINRHPAATKWIATHDFFLCKLNISQIVVLDWYGGPHFVDIKDYYNANPDTYLHSFGDELGNGNRETNEILTNDIKEDIEKGSSASKTGELRIKVGKNANVKVINIEI